MVEQLTIANTCSHKGGFQIYSQSLICFPPTDFLTTLPYL